MRTIQILLCAIVALYGTAARADQAASSSDTASDKDDMAKLDIARLYGAPDLDGP
jgi:hypothetical protein